MFLWNALAAAQVLVGLGLGEALLVSPAHRPAERLGKRMRNRKSQTSKTGVLFDHEQRTKTLEEWLHGDVAPVRQKPLRWLSERHFFRDPATPALGGGVPAAVTAGGVRSRLARRYPARLQRVLRKSAQSGERS